MKPVFADTFFFLAALNPKDAAHSAAIRWSRHNQPVRITTAWVLTEVADALARDNRAAFLRLFDLVQRHPLFRLIEPTPELFTRGVEFYRQRLDKAWSLTDCISFVVMTDEGLTEALTGDHHFEQAGFAALLK